MNIDGKSVTIVFKVVDSAAFFATNPVNIEINGMKAYSVCAYDAYEANDIYREALEEIQNNNHSSMECSDIAGMAIDKALKLSNWRKKND